MNEWKEFSAKTVDEATKEAASHYGVSVEELDIEVIEKESKGLLGIIKKAALIKAKLKEEDIAVSEEKSLDEDNNTDISDESNEEIKSEIANEVESSDNNSKQTDGVSEIAVVKSFLTNVFEAMEIEVEIDAKFDEENNIIEVNLNGSQMGVLIGKRGQTLDSLQYLASLVVNKESKIYIKVKVDTENYRERRKETLENLAKNIAHKVKRTRKPVSLEPMNPYDRRIIHSALQNDKFVETHSEGEEPNRKVVITLKKGVKSYPDKSRNGYKNNKYSDRYNSAKDYKKKFNENYKKSYQSITFEDIRSEESGNKDKEE